MPHLTEPGRKTQGHGRPANIPDAKKCVSTTNFSASSLRRVNLLPSSTRVPPAALCAILLWLSSIAVQAQDSIALREIKDLRAIVEKQSKQIEVLTEQVARLNATLNSKGEGAVPVAVAVPAAGEFLSDTAKAEAPDGKRHVVVKGETLTSIAKHYNLPLPDLQKANKGIDERKLQIGQTLVIPHPTPAEPPAEKKENP